MSTMIPTYENFNNRITYIWNLFSWHESFYSTPSYELTQVESPRWLILLQSNGFWVSTWKKATNPGQPSSTSDRCWNLLTGLRGAKSHQFLSGKLSPKNSVIHVFFVFIFVSFFFVHHDPIIPRENHRTIIFLSSFSLPF